MVHGRQGMKLEALKFSIYIIVPIGASMAFNEPIVQQVCADYFQFLKYPASPNINLREEFEELQEKRQKEKEAREAYADQIRKLQESAQSKREIVEAVGGGGGEERKGWFRW
eukprot:CAMPEP_0198257754 /NCGR_PEP_ID=MMETSP1447-20131203/7346_1 /TAXON_ID=420782 /ORGANISM="Chaetoceros dichaeta, Strain CCMP1751" /LENGTH=111 /DNA_ID=CAMNT_0043944721 /DNA_START=113 /DNA_END=445 /DNA_ORIENTATION=+